MPTALRTLLFVLLLLAFGRAQGTHIVGGEFRLNYVRNQTYNLGLTLYFDNISGSQGALDQQIRCNVFEKSTGALMDSVIMDVGQAVTFVQYNNLDCLGPTPLQTRILRYSKDLILAPAKYDDLAGYYVVWERCCRNYSITNLINPGGTGQAFYLEFPAVTRASRDFRNSSPQNFAPLAALGCVNQPFSADFSGHDPDGDLIIYKMTLPLAGNSDSVSPGQYPFPAQPRPGPYRPVRWGQGYSTNNQIGHADPLKINATTGILSFTPDRQGLFVFAVRAEEYRNGLFIGVVQREFQLLVVDCPAGFKPEISVRLDSTRPALTRRDTITILRLNGEVCLPLDVQDTNDTQFLTVSSANLPANTYSIRRVRGTTPGRTNPFKTSLCINPCPGQVLPEFALIRVITTDETCPVSLKDTSEFYVRFPPINIEGAFIQFSINGIERAFDPADTLRLFAGDTVQLRLAGRSTQEAIRVALQEPRGSLYVRLDSSGTAGDTIVQERYQLIAACEPDTTKIYNLVFYLQAQTCGQVFYLDTITVPVKIRSLDIDGLLSVFDSASRPLGANDDFEIELGQSIQFLVHGISINTNRLPELTYQVSPAPVSQIRFTTALDPTGQPALDGQLTWTPLCADTLPLDSLYRLSFLLHLIGCPEEVNADFPLRIIGRDREAPPIQIPNIITLNGDNVNDVFHIRKAGASPLCSEPFEKVEIYNRWGKRVYSSQSSDFTWAPQAGQSGNYHYLLKYGRKTYKGWLEVLSP